MEPAIRVLLVDSDPSRRETTAERLQTASDRIHVTTVDSPEAGLDRVAGQPPDCVLAAYDLPNSDGLAFFEQVREHDASVPYLLLVAGQAEVQRQAFDAGVTDVVPYVEGATDVLVDRIESYTVARAVQSTDGTARRQYQAFIDNVPGIVYRRPTGNDGRFGSAFGRCQEVSGYTGDQLESEIRWGSDVVHPEDRPEAHQAIEDALTAGERFEVTYRIQTASGEIRWVQDRGWEVDTTDGIVEGLIVDVTDQREREQKLHQEHERFLDLFSNFPEPTIAYGFDGTTTVFRRANAAFEDLFGYDETQILGESVNELLVPDTQRRESEEIDQQVETGDMVDRVVRRVAADGERIFNLRSIPVTAGGEIDGFAVYRDITERKQRERELKRQNERLEEFANIVSHDLRNPLNVAMGHLDIASQECDTPSIDRVGAALDRMEVLIHETLQLAKQGEMVTEAEPFDVRPLVEGCWEMVDNQGSTLTCEGDLTVSGDRSRVKQLFENLFRNAVEHGSTSPDSQTRQDAIDHGGPDVAVRVALSADRIVVEDDGPGVPEDEREGVFEAGHTTSEDGTGFGLAIVEEIVEAHDWDITLTDGVDGGARFEITGFDVVA